MASRFLMILSLGESSGRLGPAEGRAGGTRDSAGAGLINYKSVGENPNSKLVWGIIKTVLGILF